MATKGKPRISISTKKWPAAQRRAHDGLAARAATLAATLKPSDFDRDGNPKPGPWADLLAELDAWASQYKVELRTTEHHRDAIGSPSGGAPVPMAHSSCPGHTISTEVFDFEGGYRITMKHSCYLRRQTLLGRCVYSCDYELESGYV